MSGIYIHIPFCKKACTYCNFHFSTSLGLKDKLVKSICKEISLRHQELSERKLESIYFGGGTPSLLDERELNIIFDSLAKYYVWDDAEITLEANPDDLTDEKIHMLAKSPVNRLSIGIQSFEESELRFMNRAHSSKEAESSIKKAQDGGFDQITADLIYGIPTGSDKIWHDNIKKLLSFDLPHISAYCLTVEEGTALSHFIKTSKYPTIDDEMSSTQFDYLIETLISYGYEHYEISNFAKPNNWAVHNTNYWRRKAYLGIGPSAHSYNGEDIRSWNISHNPQYIAQLDKGNLPIEREKLSRSDMYNEFVMVSMRTSLGITKSDLHSKFPEYYEHFRTLVDDFISKGLVNYSIDRYTLTSKGKLMADFVASELFYL